MFAVLKASTDKLGPAAIASLGEHAGTFLEFCGFDGNDPVEGRNAGLRPLPARIPGCWTDLAACFDLCDGGNFHARTLLAYRRMLDAYKPLSKAKAERRGFSPDQYLFNADELAAVARAAIHPDNRQGRRGGEGGAEDRADGSGTDSRVRRWPGGRRGCPRRGRHHLH